MLDILKVILYVWTGFAWWLFYCKASYAVLGDEPLLLFFTLPVGLIPQMVIMHMEDK